MLLLGEVDLAIAGGVSESIRSFGVFASFAAQGALAHHEDPTKACRPFDKNRTGVVVAEGGALYTLERLADAKKRGARIYGELAGWAYNSDATDFVLPNPAQQVACIRKALKRAGLTPDQVDIVNTHGTGTKQGDEFECQALREVFGETGGRVHVNNTKSFIGHAMGAAGALELAGNLPAFTDGLVHPTINIDDPDPECRVPNLVTGRPKRLDRVETILNNSFGMIGINSVVVVKRYEER
jgi:3-oxoacyl-[acyl-carrier-protein] synthase II